MNTRFRAACAVVAIMLLTMAVPPPGSAAPAASPSSAFVDNVAEPFGIFGVDFVRYTGRFVGSTSLGEFRMPYEIIAPAIPELGNGVVLIEPPHFSFGTVGRDRTFGHEFLFGRGFSYAAIGYEEMSQLDPTATDLIIAGVPAAEAGFVTDIEIIVQFTLALTGDPVAQAALGNISLRYAYGASGTANTLLAILNGQAGQGLFDLSLLHVAGWNQSVDGEFAPLTGVGRVMFLASEAEQIFTDSEQFRRAADEPDYRVYEVAGAAHIPTPSRFLPGLPITNPLDHYLVARALFVKADAWMRLGVEPPPSLLMATDPTGDVDPVYGFVTGIARDQDLNALGGIRFPDLAVGLGQFIASDFSDPGSFSFIFGSFVDLSCEGAGGNPRFQSHGDYVDRIVNQAHELRTEGFLLAEDAALLKSAAAASDVGKPGTCQ